MGTPHKWCGKSCTHRTARHICILVAAGPSGIPGHTTDTCNPRNTTGDTHKCIPGWARCTRKCIPGRATGDTRNYIPWPSRPSASGPWASHLWACLLWASRPWAWASPSPWFGCPWSRHRPCSGASWWAGSDRTGRRSPPCCSCRRMRPSECSLALQICN